VESRGYGGDFGDAEIGQTILIDYPLYVTRDQNENFMGLFIGMPGKGKTWAAVRLGEQLDSTFNINRVCVTYEEFLNVLEGLAQAWDRGEDVAGRVVVFDEFQKTAGARKFMSYVNQAINDVLHTFRYLNLIVIFTTPHLSFIDVNCRAVMHFQVTMKKKHTRMGLTMGSLNFTEIKNDPWNPSDKLYHFAPRVFTTEGELRVKHIYFEKPSKPMIRQVETKINAFKHRVLTDTLEKNEQMRRKAEEPTEKTAAQKTRDLANEIFVNQVKYYDPRKEKWDKGLVLLDFPEMTSGKFTEIKTLLEAMQRVGVQPSDISLSG